MIEYIQGYISERSPTRVVIESGGLGYALSISLHTFSQIEDLSECRLLTRLVPKNENQQLAGFALYGFAEPDERSLFDALVSVSGIGANIAMTMLSSFPVDAIRSAVHDEDVATIKSVKGIGPKTAKRLILELKDKIDPPSQYAPSAGVQSTVRDEALAALVSLGFARAAATKALDKALAAGDANENVEQLIKSALKLI